MARGGRRNQATPMITCATVLLSAAAAAWSVQFENVTKEYGLIKPLKGMKGHAAAMGDINGDGYPDLFVGTFASRRPAFYNKRGHTTGSEPNKILVNDAGSVFKDMNSADVNIKGRCSGAAFADFDNDGDMDLIMSHNYRSRENFDCEKLHEGACDIKENPNHIYRNDGNGDLEDVTSGSNIDFPPDFSGRNTFVLDYDGDGLLDVLVQEDMVADYSHGKSRLMRNLGNFKFKDVTSSAGLPSRLYGLGGAVGDINGDTWPDFYMAHSDRMFINNKDGTFTEKDCSFYGPPLTDPVSPKNKSWPAGADFGDLDNDGDLDIVLGCHCKEMENKKLWVYQNTGTDNDGIPKYKDISKAAGIVCNESKTSHVTIDDFDNDGRMDIGSNSKTNIVHVNTGVEGGIPRFSAVGTGCGGENPNWSTGVFADFDQDGKLDFFGSEWLPECASALLKNTTANAGNYLDVKIDLGDTPNRNGIGAMIRIYEDGKSGTADALLGIKEMAITNGYSAGNPAVVHFGLGDHEKVDVVVTMPCDGPEYKAASVAANKVFTMTSGTPTFAGRGTIRRNKKAASMVSLYDMSGRLVGRYRSGSHLLRAPAQSAGRRHDARGLYMVVDDGVEKRAARKIVLMP